MRGVIMENGISVKKSRRIRTDKMEVSGNRW
jgi:hypothetical protein